MTNLLQQESLGCTLLVYVESISATNLKLRYVFQNNTVNSVFLFNKFWSTSLGSGRIDIIPNQVNSQVIDKCMLISKAMIPVPDDMEVEREYTPYQSKVAAHATYEEILELPLPITPHTCYTMPWHQSVSKKIVNLPLYFELGYVEITPEAEVYLKTIETSQGRVYTRSSTYQSQSTVRTGPIVAAIPVYNS